MLVFMMPSQTRCLLKNSRGVVSLLLAFFAVVGLPHGMSAQEAATVDFLIVENPAALQVYNRFEQLIPPQSSDAILPYQPLQILDASLPLSDGFTAAMKVRFARQTYYLALDDRKKLFGHQQAGDIQIYKGCRTSSLGTVEVLADQVIFLSRRPAAENLTAAGRRDLPAGTRMSVLFTYRGFSYVQVDSPFRDYGWTLLPARQKNHWWKQLATAAETPPQLTRALLNEIQAQVAQLNSLADSLFSRLNRREGKKLTPPQWRVERQGEGLVCRLFNTSAPQTFAESSGYLASNIENLLLGSGFQIEREEGIIRVVPGKQGGR